MARSFVVWDDLREDLERGAERVSERGLMMLVRSLLLPVAATESKGTIAAQRGPGGGKWVPLKDSTKRIRSTLGHLGIRPDRPINKRTGALEKFLADAGSEVLVTPGYVEGAWPALVSQDGSRLMYAFHTAQAGSKRWGTPKRPVVGLGPTGVAMLHAMTKTYIEQLMISSNAAATLIDKEAYR